MCDSSVKNISDITFNAMQILSRNMAKSYSWNDKKYRKILFNKIRWFWSGASCGMKVGGAL